MSVPVGNILRVDVIGDMNGVHQVVNTYQFRTSGLGSRTEEEVLLDLIVLLRALYAAMSNLYTALVVWRRIRVQNLTNGMLVGEMDFATALPGTAAGEQGAFQSAGLVSFKTNIPRVVMRKYIPIAEAVTGPDGRLAAFGITSLNTFGNALLSPLNGNSGWSYHFGFLSPKAGGFVEPLSRMTSSAIATQRRRRPGVGS